MGIVSGGGGGRTTYASRAEYIGNPVAIANDVQGYLTWDTLGDGVELLNRTSLNNPTVLASGIYAVTASASAQAFLTAGGGFKFILHLGFTGEDAVSTSLGGPQNASEFALAAGSCSFYVPAGGVLALEVVNRDGVASRSFALLEASVQLLS